MKKDPTAWLSAARRELDDLRASGGASLTDADAWRALALTARLGLAPADERLGAAPDRALVETWLGVCAPPDPGDLCDALGENLVGDEPPEAAVLDGLLDIDDLAGVLWLRGDEGTAATLLEDACVTLSVRPERVVSLADFARMRLTTLTPSALLRTLWSRVEGALVEAAVATQAVAASPPGAAVMVRERIARASGEVIEMAPRRRLRLPAPVALAAASHVGDSRSLGTTEDGTAGWIYEEGGTVRIELALPAEAPVARGIVLVATAGATELGRVSLPTRREGRGVFASLGPAVGSENVMRVTGARLGRDAGAVEWWIEVDDADG